MASGYSRWIVDIYQNAASKSGGRLGLRFWDAIIDSSGNLVMGSGNFTLSSGNLVVSNGDVTFNEGDVIFTDDGVTHGMLTIAPTNAYGLIRVTSSGSGGLEINGLHESTGRAIISRAYQGTGGTNPAHEWRAGESNGTGIQALGATDIAYRWAGHDGLTTFMEIFGDGNVTIVGAVGIRGAPNSSLGDLLIVDGLPVFAFKDTSETGATTRGQFDFYDSADLRQGSMGIDDQGTLFFDAQASSTSIRWLIASTEYMALDNTGTLHIGTTEQFSLGQLMLESAQPSQYWFETGRGADLGGWNLNVNSDLFRLTTVTDAGAFIKDVYHITRDGAATFFGNSMLLSSANTPIFRATDTDNSVTAWLGAQTSDGFTGTSSNHAFNIKTNNINAIRINTSQHVGIGAFVNTENDFLVANADTGTGFLPLMRLSKSRSSDAGSVGILFSITQAANHDQEGKGGIAYERTTSFGRGKLHFLMDNNATGSDVTLASSVMTLDRTGSLGLNTTSPSARFHVQESAVSSANYDGNAQIIIERTGATAALQIVTDSSNIGYVLFGDDVNSAAGRVGYDHSSNQLTFWSNALLRASFGTGGGLNISTTNTNLLNLDGNRNSSIGNSLSQIINAASISGGTVTGMRINFTGSGTVNSGDSWILFTKGGSIVGNIHSEVVYGTFTGSHMTQTEESDVDGYWIAGMIVVSSGEVIGTPQMGSAWVEVKLSSTSKDTKVYGVFTETSATESGEDDEYACWDSFDVERYALNVNALGEGLVAVTDTQGDIENGEYICSSGRRGFGERQEDDLMHSYTVAKATEDVDWDDFSVDPTYGFKWTRVACTYHCG